MTDPLCFPTSLQGAYVFDLDGTIYLGDHLLPGVSRTITFLRERNIPLRFLSNNPTKNTREYLEKLNRMGLNVELSEICNTIVTTIRWLKEYYPRAVLFPIAEKPLCDELEKEGFVLSDDPSKIDIVISSYDRGFDYCKLQIAFDAIWFYKRAFLIQTNPDRFCPFPGGRGEPDCAAMTAAIEACTGQRSRANLGKPSPIMLEQALSGLSVDLPRCVMVGDRIQTDIQMAVDAGMLSACVLTGEATLDDIDVLDNSRRPTWVLDRLDRLIPAKFWNDMGWEASD